MPDSPSPNAVTTASHLGTRPDAMGRCCLTGCSRSASTSRRSFQRYPALESAQNVANAPNTWTSMVALNRLYVNTSPANTSRFLDHCLGRSERMSAAGEIVADGRGAAPSFGRDRSTTAAELPVRSLTRLDLLSSTAPLG